MEMVKWGRGEVRDFAKFNGAKALQLQRRECARLGRRPFEAQGKQECLRYRRVLASEIARVGSTAQLSGQNDDDNEGVAEDAGGAGAFNGAGAGAVDWADGRAGAGEGGVDLRDGFAHLWMGSLVTGTNQAAGDVGTRILRRD